MTPNEVGGLQSLAMAHGGSLTINPETGLPEAGFLSSLLPMAIGFGLAPFTGGLSAALITGAGYTAATGSLKKGIMAGLGAYGGAGLGAGLSSLGTTAVAPAVPGLSPTVAANTSALAGTSPLANVGSVDILANPLANVNPAAQSMVFNPTATATAATTPGMTSATLNQTPVFDISKYPNKFFPQVTPTAVPTTTTTAATSPIDPRSEYFTDINAKIKASSPVSETALRPVSYAEQQDMLRAMRDRIPHNMADPNSFVTTNVDSVSSDAYRRGLLDSGRGGFTQYADAAKLTPRVSTYVPSDATTSQPFAGGFQGGVTPSNAVDVSKAANTTGQTISRPFSDYMSQVGRGAKTAFSSTDGLKALYSAAEAAAPYSGVASLGSTAMNYMEDKREKAEEEMRKRQAAMDTGMIRPYEFDYGATNVASEPYTGSAERTYFQPTYTALKPYKAPGPEYKADGGITSLAVGGPVEDMAAMNAVGANTGYPMANLQTPMYSNPAVQRPEATNVIAPSADAGVGAYSGEARFAGGGDTETIDTRAFFDPNTSGMSNENYTRSELAGGRRAPIKTAPTAPKYKYSYDPSTQQFTQPDDKGAISGGIAQPAMQPIRQPTSPAQPLIPNINIPAYQTPEQQLGLDGFYDYMNQQMGGYAGYAAGGGVSHLGDYSDGGRLLKGPGDGVSDSIPASIGNRQPARLADGEFVVPARIVSEIGNGSTEAGARKLYAMMDRVQKARRKTVGKDQVAANTKADKLLPA
jgi:hypothetical protein